MGKMTKEWWKKYTKTPKRQAWTKKYIRSPKRKAFVKKYCNRPEVKARRALERLRLKEACFKHYCAGEPHCMCPGCPIINIVLLDLDHINNDGAKHRRETNCRRGVPLYSWLKTRNYPPGFQVLCCNCHRAKTAKITCQH